MHYGRLGEPLYVYEYQHIAYGLLLSQTLEQVTDLRMVLEDVYGGNKLQNTEFQMARTSDYKHEKSIKITVFCPAICMQLRHGDLRYKLRHWTFKS
jgi:hypothetical protein